MAVDLIPWSGPPFEYCRLPDELTTGSSIMPQKRNPDVLELVRSRAHGVWAATARVRGRLAGLGAGYHRDFRRPSPPAFEGLTVTASILEAMTAVISRLEVDAERCRAACGPELFATEHAYRLVTEQGLPSPRGLPSCRRGMASQSFDVDAEMDRRDWANGLGEDQ